MWQLLLGALIGAAASWLISRHYYNESSRDLQARLIDLGKQADFRDSLEYFESLLEPEKWRREVIDNRTVWICREQATFRIESCDDSEQFHEEWTSTFPSQEAQSFDVDLRIAGTTIKSMIFVRVDGGRIVVPMPRVIPEGDGRHFYWDADTLEFRVGRIVGDYYIYGNIEGVAERAGISIVRGQHRR